MKGKEFRFGLFQLISVIIETRCGLIDPRTGLWSVIAFKAFKPKKGAIIFADANGLKELNDTYGYDHGHLLLENIGKFFLRLVAQNDSRAFRIGGDEFVIITSNLENGRQLLKEIKIEPYLNLAVGIALIKGDFLKALKRAEIEMKEDKSSRKEKA